jgi:hypothetical protein
MLTGNVTATTNGTARIVAHSFTGTQDTVVVVVDAPPTAPRSISSSLDAESTRDSLVPSVKPWRRHWAQ